MYEAGHPEPSAWDSLEGWGGGRQAGGGAGTQDAGTRVCLWLIHTDVPAKTITLLYSNYPPIKPDK